MPDGEIGADATFQLILQLTQGVARLQGDIEHISTDLRSLRVEIIDEKKERAAQSSEHGSDIDRIERALAGIDGLSAEEVRIVRRRMDADENDAMRRYGFKWPIIIGITVSLVTIAITVAVNLILRAIGG